MPKNPPEVLDLKWILSKLESKDLQEFCDIVAQGLVELPVPDETAINLILEYGGDEETILNCTLISDELLKLYLKTAKIKYDKKKATREIMVTKVLEKLSTINSTLNM